MIFAKIYGFDFYSLKAIREFSVYQIKLYLYNDYKIYKKWAIENHPQEAIRLAIVRFIKDYKAKPYFTEKDRVKTDQKLLKEIMEELEDENKQNI